MLDLDLINNKATEIKINREIVKVRQPSYSLTLKTKAYIEKTKQLNTHDNISNEELISEQNEILIEFLNNNLNEIKFTEEDIMKISQVAVGTLCTLLLNIIFKIEESPN